MSLPGAKNSGVERAGERPTAEICSGASFRMCVSRGRVMAALSPALLPVSWPPILDLARGETWVWHPWCNINSFIAILGAFTIGSYTGEWCLDLLLFMSWRVNRSLTQNEICYSRPNHFDMNKTLNPSALLKSTKRWSVSFISVRLTPSPCISRPFHWPSIKKTQNEKIYHYFSKPSMTFQL